MSQNRVRQSVWVKNTHSQWFVAHNSIVAQERICSNPACAETHEGYPRLITAQALCRKKKNGYNNAFCDKACLHDYNRRYVRLKKDKSGRFVGLETVQNV